MTKIITRPPGEALRAARERLGVSRAQLAGLADCSLASLERIEHGACPRRSRVLAQAWAALAELKNEQRPGCNQGAEENQADDTGQRSTPTA